MRVMISSTALDLPEHRAAAEDAVLRMSMEPRLMERLPPGSGNALERSMRLVDDSELYVAILAERYGTICPGTGKSYTHLELERAAERKLPVLLLMSPERADDAADLNPRINDLRQWAAHTFGFIANDEHFHSVDDMRAKLVLGLYDRYRGRVRTPVAGPVGRVPDPPAPYAVHPYTLSSGGIVGRDRELAELAAWLRSPDPVIQVDAIGGVGKTALLWDAYRRASAEGRLDGSFWWSFYEGEIGLDELVVRALAYVSRTTLARVRRMEPADRVESLLTVLDSGRYLLVLDGLERAFRQYAGNESAFVSEAEIREAPAAIWQPGGASLNAEQLAETRRLRQTADQLLGAFLRSLARSRGAKTIISTRLPSRDLETEWGGPLPGVRTMNLGGLGEEAGATIWEMAAGSPPDAAVRAVLASLDFHPLSIRAIAAEVGNFRQAPGDFARWSAEHPDFADVVRVRSGRHVLDFAMQGLSDDELLVLKPIAWNAQSTPFEELASVLPDADGLDRCLAALEDRRLIGWDRTRNRYDMHPIVRGRVRTMTGFPSPLPVGRPDARLEFSPDVGIVEHEVLPQESSATDGGLPPGVRLLDLLSLDGTSAGMIGERWAATPRSAMFVLGSGPTGPVAIDLRTDGPHGLLAGMTGSGKSELLRTVVAGLAAGNRPDELALLLVDYKGGAAFGTCADLPHVLELITDLDDYGGTRLLTKLDAELRRRQEVLRRSSSPTFEDHVAAFGQGAGAMPRLVIVVDEFAALVREVPSLADGLVTVAAFGRSLGVHLLMGTQRPSAVVTERLAANLNLRISLRTENEVESREMIGVPDAAHLDRRSPGRGLVQVAGGRPLEVQTAYVGGRVAGADPQDPYAMTDLEVLVSAIRNAARDCGVTSPDIAWAPVLPASVTLEQARTLTGTGSTDPRKLVFGLVDRPDTASCEPATFDLGGGRHLAVTGASRSGRTSLLRTLAASAAYVSPEELHLYVIDFGTGDLQVLGELPQVGDVVCRWEPHRLTLVVRGLGRLLDARLAAPPDAALPTVLVLMDQWEAFEAQHDGIRRSDLVDEWRRIVRLGPSAGVLLVTTGTSRLLLGPNRRDYEDVLLLRQRDRSDFLALGVPSRQVPPALPDGRGIRAESLGLTQVALVSSGHSRAEQEAALGTIAARARERFADLEPCRLPVSFSVSG